jgi:biopolymer transport protein ExbD
MNFRNERPALDARIELTPLIDVVFQLLIFFLLTTSFIHERAMQIDLPEAKVDEKKRDGDKLVLITVAKDGTVAHNDKPVSWSELTEIFRRNAAADREREVMIRADRAVPHGRVVQVMDLANTHGLTKMAIAAVPPGESLGPE